MKILVLDSVYRQSKTKSIDQGKAKFPSWNQGPEIKTGEPLGNGPELSLAFREIGLESLSLTLNNPIFEPKGIRSRLLDRGELIARLPIIDRPLFDFTGISRWVSDAISALRPDVVYCLNLNFLPVETAIFIRNQGIFLAGQIASPLPPFKYLSNYHHVFSAVPGIVSTLKARSISSSYLPLGFNPHFQGLSRDWDKRQISTIYIGSLGRHHKHSYPLLRAAAEADPGLRIYAPNKSSKLKKWGLEKHYAGKAFGVEMYKLLGNSKLCLNRHAGFAKGLSANLRMYESTGMGAALLTEKTDNLYSLFAQGEVLEYENVEDLSNVVRWSLENDEKLHSIGQAGQKRTLRDHLVRSRASEVVSTITNLIQ